MYINNHYHCVSETQNHVYIENVYFKLDLKINFEGDRDQHKGKETPLQDLIPTLAPSVMYIRIVL